MRRIHPPGREYTIFHWNLIMPTFATPLIGWIPLVNPLYSRVPHLTTWWLLLIFPLVLIISLVYQTVRSPEGRNILLPTIWFSIKVLFYMAIISIALQVLYHVVTRLSTTPL